MNFRTRSHSIALSFVLVATMVQGITPDANDLASVRALNLLVPVLNGSELPAEENGPQDDSPGSVQVPMNSIVRRLEDSVRDPGLVSIGTRILMRNLHVLGLARHDGERFQTNNLSTFLCRLTC
jgi:hypothetical protein